MLGILEKQSAIIEKGLEHNPQSSELIVARILAESQLRDYEEVEKLWRSYLYKYPANERLWKYYHQAWKARFSQFSIPAIRSQYRYAFGALAKERSSLALKVRTLFGQQDGKRCRLMANPPGKSEWRVYNACRLQFGEKRSYAPADADLGVLKCLLPRVPGRLYGEGYSYVPGVN